MIYVVLITRGSDNVDNTQIEAEGDDDAFEQAKAWAASLGLASDDNVVLAVKRPDGTLKTFNRNDY